MQCLIRSAVFINTEHANYTQSNYNTFSANGYERVSTMWYSMSLSKKLLLQTCCLLPTQAAVFEGVKIIFLIACAPTFLSVQIQVLLKKK